MELPARSLTRRRFACLLLAATLLAGCRNSDPPKTTEKPAAPHWNVLLISIDSLRSDHLSCYGYSRPTSPNIDKLAASGTLFEQMISSSAWTLPAHASMFTGLAESVHGAIDPQHRLPDSRPTLAAILKGAGYTTAGYFSGPFLHPVFGLGRGFDRYIDCSSYADRSAATASKDGTIDSRDIDDASHRDITSPRVYEQARAFLNEKRTQPFFLFVHLWDVHYDYIPPAPYDRKFDPDYKGTINGENFFDNPAVNARMPRRDLDHLIALYDGEIAWTDEHVGKILAELDRLDLARNTLVVLTSDHGTAFFDHLMKGHRNSLFEELIHIPLIVRLPGSVRQTPRIAAQTRMIDIAPTILDCLGIRPAPAMMGRSLTPALTGATLPDTEPALSEMLCYGFESRSSRFGGRKYIAEMKQKAAVAYDLQRDPGERASINDPRNPIYRAALDDFRRMLKWLGPWKSRFPDSDSPASVPADVMRSLKTFGYVGDDNADPTSQSGSQPTSKPATNETPATQP